MRQDGLQQRGTDEDEDEDVDVDVDVDVMTKA